MFEQLFEEPRALKRHRDGPLAKERLQFLAYHAARGSVRTTLRRIDNFMLAIIKEMDLQTTGEVSIGEIEAVAGRRVFRDSRNGPRKYGLTSRWWFIHVGQQWLAQLGRLRVPDAPPVPYQGMIDEYADYLRQEKGLSSYTINVRCGHVSRFLSHFYAEHRRIDNLSNEDIDRFIIKKRSSRCPCVKHCQDIRNFAAVFLSLRRDAGVVYARSGSIDPGPARLQARTDSAWTVVE